MNKAIVVEIIEINGQTIIQSENIIQPNELGLIKSLLTGKAQKRLGEPVFISGIYILDKRSDTPPEL